MRVVESCGCWTEQMPDGGVDQLVCYTHTETRLKQYYRGYFVPEPAADPLGRDPTCASCKQSTS